VDNIYLTAAAWMGLALAASLLSIRVGISVALIEIGMGVLGGNFLGLQTTYFIKAGLFVQLPAVLSGAALIAAFLGVKVGAKVIGVWPTSRAFGMQIRDANYTTLLMSTGLTFGTISALFGLTNGLIDQRAYTILVTVVILSAVIPTLIATTFFEPRLSAEAEREDFDAAEEIDAGPLRRPRPPVLEPINPPEPGHGS
jgi:Kef-type K+ transport system membrane component KefB